MDTNPRFIEIQSLTFDPKLQIRVKVDQATITKYAESMTTEEEMKTFPPVTVYYDGVKYWLADGHHRRAAAEKAGHAKVWAMIVSGSHKQALLAAIAANWKQGLGLTQADRKRAIELAVNMWPEMSNNMLATKIGCSDMTVKRYRDSISGSTNVEPEKRQGKDGKVYPAKQKKNTQKHESSKPTKGKEAKPSTQEERTTEIVTFRQGEKEQQKYVCGVRFEPDEDDDFFDWITDEERDELREMQKTCPNRLVPMIRNYTIQSIPEHDPQYLISCLFSLFKPLYRNKLLAALARKMFAQDDPDSVREIIATLHSEFQH